MCAGFSLILEERVQRLVAVHGQKYSYKQFRRVGFKSTKTKIPIECPRHGTFLQKYEAHAGGAGCAKCASNSPRYGKDIFAHIKQTSKGLVEPVNVRLSKRYYQDDDVTIRCNLFDWHPPFKRKSSKIFSRGAACQTCNQSQYVLRACKRLYENGYEYRLEEPLDHDDGVRQYVDIVALRAGVQVYIEIDGEQHFDASSFYWNENSRDYDDRKSKHLAGVLVRIAYHDDIERVIDLHFPCKETRRRVRKGSMKSFLPKSFGERLALEIHRNGRDGMSNSAIAKMHNVPRNYVSRILRGSRCAALFMYLYPEGINPYIKEKTSKWIRLSEQQEAWLAERAGQVSFLSKLLVEFNQQFSDTPVTRGQLSRYVEKYGLALGAGSDKRSHARRKK
jgi:transposase